MNDTSINHNRIQFGQPGANEGALGLIFHAYVLELLEEISDRVEGIMFKAARKSRWVDGGRQRGE